MHKMERLLLGLLLNSVLFINAIAFLFTSSNKNNFPVGYRLPNHVIPKHYNIQLDLTNFVEKESFNFSGKCDVHIEIIRPTWYIALHAQKPQIEIQTATLNNNAASLELYKPSNVTYIKETHILVFHFDYKLSKGHYLLSISFIGFSNEGNKFFRTSYTSVNNDKLWFVATPFQAIGARQMFPCWDEPALKATFNISVKHYAKYIVISNKPLQDIVMKEGDPIMWTYFHTTPLMSTYLVMVLLHDGTQIVEQKWETMFASCVTDVIMAHLKNYWKFTQNISDVISVFKNNGIQENKLTFYSDGIIFYNNILDPVAQKMEIARIVAYEITHQWFDNLISPFCWSDYWLNMGIATVLGIDILNECFPDLRMSDLFVVQTLQESFRLDNYIEGVMKPLISQNNNLSEIDYLSSFSYRIKAPVILRILQQVITNEVFQFGVEIFLTKHKFSSASLDDFWSAMQTAHNTLKPEKEIDIRKMMNAWTKQQHCVVLNITQPNFETVTISVENFIKTEDNFIFISIVKQTDPDFSWTETYFWQGYNKWTTQPNYIKSTDVPFSHKDDDWIMLNLPQNGYYRVQYELENWRKIAKYLNSANYTKIHVLNRAQIIDDAYYFLSIGQLDLLIFLELTKYLSQETDYVAWYPMVKALEDMSRIFPILGEKVDWIKKNMQEILNGLLEKIGYEERSEENTFVICLRQEVAKWACTLGHFKCIQMARFKLEQHILHFEKLLPWWKQWTYCNGMKEEDNLYSIWSKIFDKSPVDFNIRYLEILSCATRPNVIKGYLNDMEIYSSLYFRELRFSAKGKNMRDIDHVKQRSLINNILFLITKHANNNEILEHVLQNFDDFKRRKINMHVALIVIINHVYTAPHLNKIVKFVTNYLSREENIFINNLRTSIVSFDNKFDNKARQDVKHFLLQLIYNKITKRTDEILALKSSRGYL